MAHGVAALPQLVPAPRLASPELPSLVAPTVLGISVPPSLSLLPKRNPLISLGAP